MTAPETYLFAPPRRLRKRRPGPPPAVVNRIVGVAHGPSPEVVVATITGGLTAIGDVVAALVVDVEGNTYEPIDVSLDALPEVAFTFGRDVSAATAWSVPDAWAWEFTDGQPLSPPLSGSIG